MRQRFGETRSTITRRHALISADSHEVTSLPNWPGSDIVFTITPQMGARFSQYFATMPEGAEASEPLEGMERFLFVLEGDVELVADQRVFQLQAEHYAFLPMDQSHRIRARTGARLVLIERAYIPLKGHSLPDLLVSSTDAVTAQPLKGDDMLMLKKLMPEDLSCDFEVNTMDFSPGAGLAYVETHFMEHGLLFLNGGGVYRLDDQWYPVEQGDTIWMGPYCAQWFGAIGRNNARYLIYKNWNRDPHQG